MATSVLANVNRNFEKKPEPYKAEDFIYWKDIVSKQEEEPAMLDDPVAHSNLIRAALFGLAPKTQDK